MKRRTRLVAIVTVVMVTLAACYPQGPDYIEDLDTVLTHFRDGYDFNAKLTYARPNEIVKVTGNLDEGDSPAFIPSAIAAPILARIDQNMAALGYQKVDIDDDPDLLLPVASWETTTIYYYYDYWSWYWGGYYPYWGWGYPPYVSSYTTGTLFMGLVDPTLESANGNILFQWSGAASGILTSSYSAARVNDAIDRAFAQSPYLKTN
jgi:hypothetical protein